MIGGHLLMLYELQNKYIKIKVNTLGAIAYNEVRKREQEKPSLTPKKVSDQTNPKGVENRWLTPILTYLWKKCYYNS